MDFDARVEPTGWVRCFDLGKPDRRRPDGSAASEFGEVEHHRLTPARDEANKLTSVCPFCGKGMLMCERDLKTLVLKEFDRCTLCGQQVKYADIDDLRKKDWARSAAP